MRWTKVDLRRLPRNVILETVPALNCTVLVYCSVSRDSIHPSLRPASCGHDFDYRSIASRSTVALDGRRLPHPSRRKSGSPSVRVATGLRLRRPLAEGGRLSTGHISFVLSTRRQLPRSMPGQRPGTVSDGDRRTAAPVGAPTAVDILASFPPVRGLVFGSTACGGSREVGVLLAQAASSSAQRQWRSLGARSMLRFVRVIRVPACARVSRVSRVCPGSPRCPTRSNAFLSLVWYPRHRSNAQRTRSTRPRKASCSAAPLTHDINLYFKHSGQLNCMV